MDQAFNIIVIILSSVLFIFLIIGVVVGVYVAKLVKQLQGIAARGHQIADDAAAFTHNITNAAGAAGFFQSVAKIFSAFKKGK